MTDIPLATILRINAARTIPLARYEEEGNFDRFGYIKDLAENHGADLAVVTAALKPLDRCPADDGFKGRALDLDPVKVLLGLAVDTDFHGLSLPN